MGIKRWRTKFATIRAMIPMKKTKGMSVHFGKDFLDICAARAPMTSFWSLARGSSQPIEVMKPKSRAAARLPKNI